MYSNQYTLRNINNNNNNNNNKQQQQQQQQQQSVNTMIHNYQFQLKHDNHTTLTQ